jgi:hypothetical protein
MQYSSQQQSAVPEQDLVIYLNRKLTIFFALFSVCWLLLAFPFLIQGVFSVFDFPSIFTILFTILMVLAIGLSIDQVAGNIHAAFTRQPVLIINHEGIRIRALPGSAYHFIAWSEISTISIRSYRGLRYFCVHPRDFKQYARRLSPLRRLILRSYMLTSFPPIHIALIYLERPIEEILYALQQTYAGELNYYRILLLP